MILAVCDWLSKVCMHAQSVTWVAYLQVASCCHESSLCNQHCRSTAFLCQPICPLKRCGCTAQGGVGRSDQGQGTAAGGQGASGLLGALAQSIGPMMQQLMVGDGSSANAPGPTSGAPMRSSTADWKSALSELDEEEQAEWERVIRCLPSGPLPHLHACTF